MQKGGGGLALTPEASPFPSFSRLLSLQLFAAQLLLTCSDPTAYPCSLGALAPHWLPQWSLTKAEESPCFGSVLQPGSTSSIMPHPSQSSLHSSPNPMANGQEAPLPSREKQTQSVDCVRGLGQDWVRGMKTGSAKSRASKADMPLSYEVAVVRLGKGGKGVLQALAQLCVMGRAYLPAHLCPHGAAVWAPAMARESS